MHEERCYRLIYVFTICLNELNIEKPFIHLMRPFQERIVVGWIVNDVNDCENNDVQKYEEGGH
jgi:hypothetical protein